MKYYILPIIDLFIKRAPVSAFRIAAFVLALSWASRIICVAQQSVSKPYLVVLSLDGFRWDYPDSFPTPHLDYIAHHGVKAKSLIPVFPTVTFSNHYSIATGLYPDHHGIVHNNFYAPEFNVTYRYQDTTLAADGKFYNGEPIWVTAEKQHLKTACYNWVGSEALIKGLRPGYWKKYSKQTQLSQQIDTVAFWLSLPESVRPHLMMLYTDQPDHLTHPSGPFGSGVRQMVVRLDSLIGVLLERLSQLKMDNINFMIVSDHGMETVSDEKKIVLDKYLPTDWCEHVAGNHTFTMLDAKTNLTDSVFNHLARVPHLQVWKNKDLPKRFHYGKNPRIGNIVILADSTYSLTWGNEKIKNAGDHGYDNRNHNMHGIFYGFGPAFKSGYLQPSFVNVDLYSLMAFILKIKPSANDGNLKAVYQVLK